MLWKTVDNINDALWRYKRYMIEIVWYCFVGQENEEMRVSEDV